jgi:hypothetical protein
VEHKNVETAMFGQPNPNWQGSPYPLRGRGTLANAIVFSALWVV